MYYEPVKAYLENFSKVKVFLFEDLIADPKSFMGETYDFLGAEKSFSPNTEVVHNPTYTSKNKLFKFIYFIKRRYRVRNNFISGKIKKFIFNKTHKKERQKMNAETRKYLCGYFKGVRPQLDVFKHNIGSVSDLSS
jgi:hypothetical protein